MTCAAEGPPAWLPPRTVATAGHTAGPPVATDVNGDGKIDIVFPCAGTDDGDNDGRLAVFLGDGEGAFKPSAAENVLPFPGRGLSVAIGDVNEDGRVDVAAAHHDSYDVAILLGDGEGAFADGPRPLVTMHDGPEAHTHAVALADLNADSHLDLVTTCADDNAIAVMLGDGAGGFERAAGSPFDAGEHPYEGLAVGMMDGDGHPDIAVANLWGDAASILIGDGRGGFAPSPTSPVLVGPRPGFLTLGDLNGDEALDLVVTHDDDPIADVLLGDGAGGMRAMPESLLHLDQPVWEAVIADLDGDGNGDVLLGGSRDHVIVLLGDGEGGIRPGPIRIPTPRPGPGYVEAADVNGDGREDLIIAYYESDVIDICFSR